MVRRQSSHIRPRDAAESIPRLLNRAYVLALSLVAALGLLFAWGLSLRIDRQVDDYRVVNRAGFQRALSQRIAALAPALVDEAPAGPEDARELFLATLSRLREGHAALTRGADAPARRCSALERHYFGVTTGSLPAGASRNLDEALRSFLANCDRLLELTPHGSPLVAPVAAQVRADALGPLLDRLDAAVSLHQEQASESLRAVVRFHGLATAMLLTLLGLEVVFIFRPLARYTGRQSARLAHAASHDPLTGLLNRAAFDAALDEAAESRTPLALAIFDLDGFKQTNDREGHVAGDAVLVAAAGRLRGVASPGDVVARLGGDEFAWVLMDVANPADVHGRLEALVRQLREPVVHQGRRLQVGATVGVAFAPEDARDADTLVRLADAALIGAKRDARGGIGRVRAGSASWAQRDGGISAAPDPRSLTAG